jgi:hypothetical protein
LTIFTCSYSEFERQQAPDRLPVRTTLGAPTRRPPTYAGDMASLREVTPLARFLRPVVLPRAEYEREYRNMLAGYGPERIQQRISVLLANSGRQHPVLLCFDNLAKPGGWCHRSMFAGWWLEQTGEEVIELGRRYVAPTGGTTMDATLFDDIRDGA